MFLQIVGAVPAEITTALEDLTGLWDDIKPFIMAVGVFLILWRFFRRRAKA